MPEGSPRTPPAKSDWTKPLRNAGRLAAGRGVQAICSLVYLAIAARALGPTDFGALVLIHALALGITQFSSFGSKDMLVRFGAMAVASQSPDRLRRLIWFGVFLDVFSTLLAWIIMGIAAHWALARFELPSNIHGLTLAYWFAAVAVANLSQTSTGILRLFDRFRALAYQSTVEPMLRLILSVVVLQLHGGLLGFLLAWFAALLAGRITTVLSARHTLKKHDYHPTQRPSLREVVRPERGVWRFVLWLQWTTTIGLVDTHLPLVAIGSVLDAASAGLFKVAQQITAVLERANSKLVVPSLYTELARLSAHGADAERRHLVMKLTVWMVGVAVALVALLALLGKPLITLVAGAKFVGAYDVMLWLAGAGAVGTLSVTLEPLLMASGRVRVIALAGTLPLLVYVPMVFGLMGPGGLTGVGMATLYYAILNSTILVIGARQTLRAPSQR